MPFFLRKSRTMRPTLSLPVSLTNSTSAPVCLAETSALNTEPPGTAFCGSPFLNIKSTIVSPAPTIFAIFPIFAFNKDKKERPAS